MSLVSVVIPTLGRPRPLLRALRSVLDQTHRLIEVIVVIDRPDDNTDAILQAIDDPRLRVVVNPRPLNAAAARNLGIDHAQGEWVAFLDDDDEWLPGKIEKQLALGTGRGDVLVSCLSRVVTPLSSYVLPHAVYDNSLPVDEYLFDRRSPIAPLGFIQTSSFLMPRSVLDRIRFAVTSPHEDWDFVLRLSKNFHVRIETVPEVLVVLHFEQQGKTLQHTYSNDWAGSLAWIDTLRPIITRRAYGGFCLSVVAEQAARAREYRVIVPLLYRTFRHGSPRFWRLGAFVGFWVLPRGMVRRLRTWLKSATGGHNRSMTSGLL